jgi:adenylate cyclase class 2
MTTPDRRDFRSRPRGQTPSRDIEAEIKIPVENLDSIREALIGGRATSVHPMAREVNLLLDTDDGCLQDAGNILRLRRYGSRHILTFKGPAVYHGPVKERPEHETEIENTEKMLEILDHLGLRAVARYEKDREMWLVDEISVVLDHTPMGDFVEVEGPRERLQTAVRSLGLEPSTAVKGSYLSLWREHRSRHPEKNLPVDMVFET